MDSKKTVLMTIVTKTTAVIIALVAPIVFTISAMAADYPYKVDAPRIHKDVLENSWGNSWGENYQTKTAGPIKPPPYSIPENSWGNSWGKVF